MCEHFSISRLVKSLIEDMGAMDKTKEFEWKLNKIHAISHYKNDIKRSGATHHYNAELFENLHQKVMMSTVLPFLLHYS